MRGGLRNVRRNEIAKQNTALLAFVAEELPLCMSEFRRERRAAAFAERSRQSPSRHVRRT